MQRRKSFLIAFCLFSSIVCFSQKPVSFSYSVKKKVEKNYEVRITATVEKGWHIYSQGTPDGGPSPTVINFSKNPLVELNGKIKEVGDMHKKFEEVFDVNVHYYDNKVEFIQLVKLKSSAKTNLSGTIDYMVCNNEQCLPPKTISFSVAIL